MKGKAIIIVKGKLDKKWQDYFEGIEINYNEDNSILAVKLKDEAHLHGILNLIRDLNLQLISVNPADEVKGNR